MKILLLTFTLALAGIVSTSAVLADNNSIEMDPKDIPDTPSTMQLPSTSPETKPTSSVGNAGNTKPIGTDKQKTDLLQH